jgi:hypothetical protein
MKYHHPERAPANMPTNTVPMTLFSVADRRRSVALFSVLALSFLVVGSLMPAMIGGVRSVPMTHVAAPVVAAVPVTAGGSPSTFSIPRGTLAGLHAFSAPVSIPSLIRAEASAKAQGLPLGSVLGAAPGSDLRLPSITPLAPHPTVVMPTVSSTGSNFVVTGSNCSSESTVVQAGGSNSSLLATGNSILGIYNGTGGTPCATPGPSSFLFNHGLSVAYRSTDGGRSWASDYLGLASGWSTSSDKSYLAFNVGGGDVASSPSNLSLFATSYNPQCYIFGYVLNPALDANCTTATQLKEAYNNWGVDVGRSTDGGVSWAAPVQVSGTPGLMLYNNPSCVGTNGTFTNFANLTERPWVALNGFNNVAVAGWDILHYAINYTACTIGAVAAWTQISVSIDGGVTWSVPRNESSGGAEAVQIAIGPAPTYPISLMALDFNNATVQASNGELDLSITYAQSTNNGTTFTVPGDVGGQLIVHNAPVTTPAAWRAFSFPSMAVDNWSASTHRGSVYIAWADNQTGAVQGHAAIDLLRSGNGVTFGTPTTISLPGNAHTYFQPTVRVGPDGKVWVIYIGNDATTGNYRTYGVVSSDGGLTWSSQFVVGDQDSVPGTSIISIGFNLGVVATTAGAFAVWSDCRAIECGSPTFIEYLFAAQVQPMTLATNAVGTPLTITVAGWANTVRLPNTTAFDTGITVTVSAPSTFPDPPSHVWAFVGYSGAVTSPNQVSSFSQSGAPSLTVTYLAVQASWITGTFFPRETSSLLTVNGFGITMVPLNATTLAFNWSVAANQTYMINASAAKYVSIIDLPVTTLGGQASPLHINLLRTPGWIAGVAYPANATIKINGTTVTPSPTTGIYNYSAGFQWGDYWVNASSPGLSPFSRYVPVYPGATSSVRIDLGGGWINGTVAQAKASLRVSIDGIPLNSTVLINGVFSFPAVGAAPLRGGFHLVTATQTGYNLSRTTVFVTPGQGTIVNITLSNKGWITGLISPQAALSKASLKVTNKTVGGGFQAIDAATGTFNVSVLGGYNWSLTVAAAGYSTVTLNVSVTAGNASQGSPVSITLTPTATCTTNCPPPPCTVNCGSTTSTSSNTLLLYGVIIAVIVVAAIVAALLLMRGRRRGPRDGEETTEDASLDNQTYQSSPTADLPKLQSDGSFGEGPPPQ